jgi:hypothetical protein
MLGDAWAWKQAHPDGYERDHAERAPTHTATEPEYAATGR